MKRLIRIRGQGTDLPLTKVTELNLTSTPHRQMIHLDELADGSWRLTYTAETLPNIKAVEGFEIVRIGP